MEPDEVERRLEELEAQVEGLDRLTSSRLSSEVDTRQIVAALEELGGRVDALEAAYREAPGPRHEVGRSGEPEGTFGLAVLASWFRGLSAADAFTLGWLGALAFLWLLTALEEAQE